MQYHEWFKIDKEKQDYENVISFVRELPNNFEYLIFNKETSNFIETYFRKSVNEIEKLFSSSFQESVNELKRNIILLDGLDLNITSDNNNDNNNYYHYYYYSFHFNNIFNNSDFFHFTLNRIGFVNDSLKLKSLRLNELWKEIVDYANSFTQSIIDFSNNDLVKLMRKFLTYLNSLLGSLTNLFPGIDSMKEFKEIIESYLSIAEN